MGFQEILNALIAKRIKDSGKITKTTIAERCGMYPSTFNRLTTGIIRNPSPDQLQKIGDFFDVSTDQLLGLQPIAGINDSVQEPSAGYSIPSSDIESTELLNAYRHMSDSRKRLLRLVARDLLIADKHSQQANDQQEGVGG